MKRSHVHAANVVISLALVGCSPTKTDTPAETRGQAEQAQIVGTTCVTIQRTGAGGAVADTEIADNNPTKNYGGKATADDGLVGHVTRHALFRFDLSALPPAVAITSAEVRLSASGSGSDVRVHRINAPWDEGAVTWQSFGGAYDPSVVATFDNANAVFSIRDLTQWWADHMLPNDGILLEQSSANTVYETSESPHVAHRPALTVCYACGLGFADCDGDAANGCETALDTSADCGACGVSCASPDTCVGGVCTPPSSCRPQTCAELDHGCGPSADGCGNLIDCGSCPAGLSCGAGAPYFCAGCDIMNCRAPNVCMGGACMPPTGGCNAMSCPGGTCIDDYCLLAGDPTCGPMICPPPFGVCTSPVSCLPAGCTPMTCAQQGIQCGPAGDGCGGVIQCGSCPQGQTCGGGGQPFVCGSGAAPCNPATCPLPNTCTGGVCVPPVSGCTPLSCGSQGIACGPSGDGCGGVIDCGSCPMGETCGGGGQRYTCGAGGSATCNPMTCPPPNACLDPSTCGLPGGCGPMSCPPPGVCSGAVCIMPPAVPCDPMSCLPPFVCTTPVSCTLPGGSPCVPLTCAELGHQCDAAGDGCGGAIDCGTCPSGQSCGGDGVPYVCGGGTPCDPMSCPPPSMCTGPFTCSPPPMMCDPMTCPPPGVCVNDVCTLPM